MCRRELIIAATVTVVAAIVFRSGAHAMKNSDGRELIGRPAPPLELTQWLHSRPLEITGLRGKVVLLRWWTPGWGICEATAPALRKLQREYGDRGLQVIGIYHPKPAGDWDLSKVEAAAKEKQFTFPEALDADWTALKRWWLYQERDYTSVSFLVDRKGAIRYIHPGGEFHEGAQGALPAHETCQRDFHAIETEIGRLLSE